MTKKGLGVGEVFVFIVAAITFALIMIFGYRYVTEFMVKGEKVEFYQFKTDLENSIQKIYSEYEAVRVKQFRTPLKYEQICFVDLEQPDDSSLCDQSQIACDIWKEVQDYALPERYDKSEENVFLKPSAPIKIKVQKISIAPPEGAEERKNFLCLEIVNGAFSLRMEGKGDRTELSPG